MSFFASESTGRANQNIDEILRENMEATMKERGERFGTIGPTPFMETEEGQDFLFDMVTGSPGGAIGRVSKGLVTGGHLSKNMLDQYFKRIIGVKPKNFIKNLKGLQKLDYERLLKNSMGEDNKINAVRLRAQKIFDKHNIPHESEVVDPVTSILDILKRN